MQKRYFDSQHSPLTFLPGDLAMLVYFGTLNRPHKLAPTGSVVQIIEAVSPVAYRVCMTSGSCIHDMISVEHLRPYCRRGDLSATPLASTPTTPPPAVATVPGATRTRDGRREVQVLCDGEFILKLATDDAPPPPRRSQRLLDGVAPV